MQFENVIYEASDRVALITLNRPKYRNAQSYPLLDELDAALEKAVGDPEVLAGAEEEPHVGLQVAVVAADLAV